MNKGNARILFGLGLFIFCFAIGAQAQGVIVPIICERRPCVPPRPIPPRPIPVPNALPVKSINIDTKINGQVATTHLEQVFRNDTPYTLEGTYFFPIPETASIVEFAIWENGKKLVGEVRTREEARRIYEEIVRRQRDPGLLEYVGKNLFQASIFPIPPHSDKKLELTYTQVLKAESGTVAYRYPLGTGQRAWLEPNGSVEATRGSRPDKVGTVSGRVEIQSKEALRNIYSPTHSIDVKKKGENGAVLTFETSEKNLLDFQLFYGISAQDFGMTLLTYREAAKDGFFLLLLSPKDNILERELITKDIVFVLDTSGSMADEGKMEKARSALLFGIRTLREGDRFNVINFAGEEHLMENGLIPANAEGKRRGEEFVKKLQPTGGTNINDALIAAKKQFAAGSGDRPKILVFMTDGLPTVGETNVEKIIQNFDREKIEGLRLFNFGVGYDVNTTLLDKLASENSGAADYVEPKEDLEIKVSNFFSKVNFPVLTDLEIDFGNVQTELIYPRKTPDLFKGTQIALIGRYKTFDDRATIILRGRDGREVRTFRYNDLNFPQRDEENAFLPKLWAIRRVGWLTEQIRNNGEQKELKDEIIQLGTRYGIVTPYTSFLAMENNLRVTARNEGALRVFQNSAPSAAKEKSGQGAVTLSQNTTAQQNTVDISADGKEDNEIISFSSNYSRQVGNKNFYYLNNVWQDAEFEEKQRSNEIRIKFASDEFFDLLAREKELAQFFALGEEVVVVWKGKVYRVTK
jgi:Ca-activated chloride channel family protein